LTGCGSARAFPLRTQRRRAALATCDAARGRTLFAETSGRAASPTSYHSRWWRRRCCLPSLSAGGSPRSFLFSASALLSSSVPSPLRRHSLERLLPELFSIRMHIPAGTMLARPAAGMERSTLTGSALGRLRLCFLIVSGALDFTSTPPTILRRGHLCRNQRRRPRKADGNILRGCAVIFRWRAMARTGRQRLPFSQRLATPSF